MATNHRTQNPFSRKLPTADRLRKLLSYDPDSGSFTWVEDSGRLQMKNKIAGRINEDGILIRVDTKEYPAGRLAWLYMTGNWPTNLVDHKDRNPLNNRWCNLREATHSQNSSNRISSRNTSGHKGVSWNKRDKLWMSYITVNGERRHLGCFRNAEDAARVYREAASNLHGEFACF